MDVSGRESGPQQLADTIFYHKWFVARTEQLDPGELCWVVEVYAHRLPANVKNDQGDEPLYRLYLNQTDLSLRRFECNRRSRTYLVTGKPKRSAEDLIKGNPMMVTWVPGLCPLDIPVLPLSWLERGLPEDAKEKSYVDERSGYEVIQRTEPFLWGPDGGRSPAMLISLTKKGSGVRTQLWVPGCPWWLESRRQYENGRISGLWYSRTIDWKGKPAERTALDMSPLRLGVAPMPGEQE